MPTPRIDPERTLTGAERQKRYAERRLREARQAQEWFRALQRIASAKTVKEAREIAEKAMS